jgi:hypothetical protein
LTAGVNLHFIAESPNLFVADFRKRTGFADENEQGIVDSGWPGFDKPLNCN